MNRQNEANIKVMKKISVILMLGVILFLPCMVIAQGNGLYEFIGKKGKRGFMDKTGKVVIPAKYFRSWEFSEGLAFVSEKRASNGDFIWICIDTLGKKIFSIEQQNNPYSAFSDGYAVITNYTNCWFVNRKGKRVFDKKFKYASEFTNGFARVCDKSITDSYFIDKRGVFAKHLPEDCSVFINGIAKCGRQLIDTLGNILIDSIHEWTNASYEFLKVARNDKWGFIDRKGNIVIDFQYKKDKIGFFHEGLASFQKDTLFGFINLKNEIFIEPIFKRVRYFSEGLAGASLDGKIWGFINKEGEFVIEPQYFYVDAFKNGVCGVLLTEREYIIIGDYHLNAIINKNGEILYRGEMHSYMGFQGELIKYYDGGNFRGKIHYLDKNGKPVIPKE
jgi:hypothetical protein